MKVTLSISSRFTSGLGLGVLIILFGFFPVIAEESVTESHECVEERYIVQDKQVERNIRRGGSDEQPFYFNDTHQKWLTFRDGINQLNGAKLFILYCNFKLCD